MSEQKPTQPAPSPFHHTARAANPAMLAALYRRASAVLRRSTDPDEWPEALFRQGVLTKELRRRDLGPLADDLATEARLMGQLLIIVHGDPVAAVVARRLAQSRQSIHRRIALASR